MGVEDEAVDVEVAVEVLCAAEGVVDELHRHVVRRKSEIALDRTKAVFSAWPNWAFSLTPSEVINGTSLTAWIDTDEVIDRAVVSTRPSLVPPLSWIDVRVTTRLFVTAGFSLRSS